MKEACNQNFAVKCHVIDQQKICADYGGTVTKAVLNAIVFWPRKDLKCQRSLFLFLAQSRPGRV